jgi:choline dehydrogenase-like flavoprotein
MSAFNIPGKGTAENTYDVIVIGSGITGGIAAKELTEAGLTVLVLERGRMVEHIKDYPTALTDPWDLPLRNLVSLEEQKNYEVQKSIYLFGQDSKHFSLKTVSIHTYRKSLSPGTVVTRLAGVHCCGRNIVTV